jgi:hypothetical protein
LFSEWPDAIGSSNLSGEVVFIVPIDQGPATFDAWYPNTVDYTLDDFVRSVTRSLK